MTGPQDYPDLRGSDDVNADAQTLELDQPAQKRAERSDLDGLFNRLNKLSRIPPDQMGRAANYAADHPENVAFLTIRDFSDKAGVSPASTLRMARALGFSGYRDFREAFRQAMKSTPAQTVARKRFSYPADEFLSNFCSVSLTDLPGFNAELNRVADRILSARTVYVVGFRSAHSFAQYFVYHAHIVMPGFRLASSAMSSAAAHLASAGQDDLVIFFSMEPYATEAVQLAFYLARQNIPSVAITDNAQSPFASRCTHVLETRRLRVGPLQSMAGCVSVSEALLGRCFEKIGPDASRKLSEFEHRIRSMRGYWPPE